MPNDLSKSETQIKAVVLPGPKRFCLSKISRTVDLRWTFATRYFDCKGKKHEHQYSADTFVDIETRRVTIVTRIRGSGFIPCDCQCAFMNDHIHERNETTLHFNLKGDD